MKTTYLPNHEHPAKGGSGSKDAPDLIELGKNIQWWREQVGMTQEELGMEIGADKGKISRYESGQMVMKVDRLFQIAEVLQVPVDELCPKWLRMQEWMVPRVYQLVKMIQELPMDKRDIFLCAAEAMVIGFRSAE